jgi:hypothetical protein
MRDEHALPCQEHPLGHTLLLLNNSWELVQMSSAFIHVLLLLGRSLQAGYPDVTLCPVHADALLGIPVAQHLLCANNTLQRVPANRLVVWM